MAQEPTRQSPRQFDCRDQLWQIFQQLSVEQQCSVDSLINEAMAQYAHGRAQPAAGRQPAAARPSLPPPPVPGAPRRAPIPSIRQPTLPALGAPRPATRPLSSPPGAQPYQGAAAAQARPSIQGAAAAPARPSIPPPLPSVRPSAQTPAAAAALHANGGSRPRLYLLFNGRRYTVDKDEFIIGRGSKSADLPIKDGNISRRHAAVILQNGSYFMQDLGSTNGVEFAGQRVGVRRIQEGDSYKICDYELRFTYV